MSTEDAALVAAARRGDPDAFAALYRRHRRDVHGLAALTLGDHAEAEDATQETFLKAYRALRRTRGVDAVRPWLLTICRRTCLDRVRARAARAALALDDERAGEPASGSIDVDLLIDVRSALAALPAAEREAFFLVDVLGCRSDEAAAIVGLRAASTLRSRVARAREALAAAVGEASGQARAEVWGVLHAATGSAIVSCPPAGPCPARGVDELRARLRATGCAELAPGGRGGLDVVTFLELLERRIPVGRRPVAVLDRAAAGAAAPIAAWVGAHPRWRVRGSASHDSWLEEVGQLLGARSPLRRLAGEEPFLWTLAS